ncbi:MAG: DUF58 domain-containing protein [Acidimicrobiales bacterium]
MVVTRRFALVALVVAVARLVLPDDLPTGRFWEDLGVLAAALAVLWLVDLALATSPAQVAVARLVPRALVLGQQATIGWRFENTTSRMLHLAFADELAPSLHADVRRASLTLPPKGSATVRTVIRPSRRGRFSPTDLVVRVVGPLGLAARQRTRDEPSMIRVHPPFRSKDEAELRINKARVLEVGLRSAQGRGGGTEFEQLREYGPDDEFRRVDWAATARAGKAIVRTYRAERNQTVLVMLDAGRLMAARVDDVPRLEHAMDATLMLTTVATRLGDKCGLLVFDSHVGRVLAPSRSRGQVGVVTEALFDLEPALVETDYRGAFAAVIARFRRRALLVLLTELVEQAAEESLVPALPLITRSHVVVVGAVRDPEVERWATEVGGDPEIVYRRAAALAALAERARVAARLRAMGATVVDAAPGQLSGDLADTYLRLKAIGRL